MTDGAETSRAGVAGRETWLALLIFTLLTVVFAYPLSLHPTTLRFPTGPDGDLGWYLLGWNTHAFLHEPWNIFDANIYYPMHNTLAYGENVIGISIFAAPIIWLTGDLLLAANFSSMLSTVLCGFGAYLLARRLGLSWMAALLAGIVFECAPPRFFRIAQINLSSVQWIPLGLAALHAYFDDGRRWMLRVAAACVTLQALSSGHGIVFMMVVLLVFAIYRLAMGEPVRVRQWMSDLGVAGVLLLLPTVLVFLPYLEVQREVGLRRGLGTWGVNYSAFLSSPSHVHQYLIRHLAPWVNETAQSYLFPGILALLFAGVAIASRRASADRTGRKAVLARPERAVLAAVALGALAAAWPLLQLTASGVRLHEMTSVRLLWIVALLTAAAGLVVRRWLPADIAAWHRGPLIAILLSGIGWWGLAEARTRNIAGTGLSAAYYTSADRTGDAVLTGRDLVPSTATMAIRWNGAVPQVFSARWSGHLIVPRTGSYRFALTSDDGSRLFVRYRPVIENGGAHQALMKDSTSQLEAGEEPVTLEFEQYGATALLNWQWARDGGPLEPVPSWALSPQRVSLTAARAAQVIDVAVVPLALLTLGAILWAVRRAILRREPVRQWCEANRHDARLFYAVLTLVAIGFAIGPPYGLWQFVYWWPGFSFIRETSRFVIVALLGLSVLAGIGFDRVTARLSPSSRHLFGLAIALLLVAEYAAFPMTVAPSNLDVPSIDRWLDTLPKPFVIAEAPVFEDESNRDSRQQAAYMIHSSAHWQKTIHGYSGWRSELSRAIFRDMEKFPDDVSLNRLASIGVTHVVVHPGAYPADDWPAVAERIERYASQLRLLHSDASGSVYALERTQSERLPRD